MPAQNGFTISPIGEIYITTNVPDANSVWAGGFCFNATGQLHISTVPAGTDFYIGGCRFNISGALVVGAGDAPNRPYFVNDGLPTRLTDNAMVYQLDQVPSANDPYVQGIRVGALGGVYMSTAAPT
jgi:hypothetical protein